MASKQIVTILLLAIVASGLSVNSVSAQDSICVVSGDSTEDRSGCLDSDGDGIFDPYDSCPDSNPELTIDENGCNLAQKDSDNDGVNDLMDDCPGTEIGIPVLSDGCLDEAALAEDIDGDGVSNILPLNVENTTNLDKCPYSFTSNSTDLNENGCSDDQEIPDCPVCNSTQIAESTDAEEGTLLDDVSIIYGLMWAIPALIVGRYFRFKK